MSEQGPTAPYHAENRNSYREWRAMIVRKTGVRSIAPLLCMANVFAPFIWPKLSRLGEPMFGYVIFGWVALNLALVAVMWTRYRQLQKLHPWSATAAAEDYMRA